MEILYSFALMFITCEIGQEIYNAFDECGDMINQFGWYLFPKEIQRILPIIVNFAQQPIVFYCFGSTACVRQTFKYVRIGRDQFYKFVHLFIYEILIISTVFR